MTRGKKHSLESRGKMSAASLRISSPDVQKQKYSEMLPAGVSRCIKCGEVKPFSEYPTWRTRRNGEPRYAYCKKCHSKYQRESKLKNFFLMTVEDADKVFSYQGNLCAICRKPPSGAMRLALDHRHSDGLVRGGLCNWCNRAIARFNNNIARLRAAADYLEKPPAIAALGREHFARPGRIGTKKQRAAIRKEKRNSGSIGTDK